MQIDHVLVSVSGLASAVEDFTRAGFKVYYGAAKDHAYNAMVYLEDGTFIELVDVSAFPRWIALLHKWHLTRLFGGMGKRVGKYATVQRHILDIALHAPDISLARQRLKETIPVSKCYNLKRVNADGLRLTWQLFAPVNVDLPFVMSAYHPQRLPQPDAAVHDNGVHGIAQVHYCVNALSPAYVAALSNMLQEQVRQEGGDVVVDLPSGCQLRLSSGGQDRIVLLAGNVTPEMQLLARYGVEIKSE
jgi:hypothetical protein